MIMPGTAANSTSLVMSCILHSAPCVLALAPYVDSLLWPPFYASAYFPLLFGVFASASLACR